MSQPFRPLRPAGGGGDLVSVWAAANLPRRKKLTGAACEQCRKRKIKVCCVCCVLPFLLFLLQSCGFVGASASASASCPLFATPPPILSLPLSKDFPALSLKQQER